MIRKLNGASVDAFALTFVRIVTMIISMVIYKLLTVTFSLEEYGTYASAALMATTISSLTILGLTDAINFFYVKDKDRERGKVYVYTIFLIQIIIGLISAGMLILLRNQIALFFKNPMVAIMIPGIAFTPLLTNISHMLQVLFVSAKKAKVLALRNLVIAVLKIAFVVLACQWWKNIYAVIIMALVLDLGNVLYMVMYCKKNIFCIDLQKANLHLSREIFKYSLPMSACILTNALSKNMDKMVIGALGTSEMMGIYSIAAKELPFDLLTTSFLTVLVPYITRYIGDADYSKASAAFSQHIQITYITTWIIAFGALACADDLMRILYDDKYLSGLGAFCLYILVDMMKFANVSIIFSVSNRAKELLCYSGMALVLNAGLNIVFYKVLGMIGPAVSTVIVTFLLSCVIMYRSASLLKTRVLDLINYKQMAYIICECLICATAAFMVKKCFSGGSPLFRFMTAYSVYAIPLLIFNYKRVVILLRGINQMKLA